MIFMLKGDQLYGSGFYLFNVTNKDDNNSIEEKNFFIIMQKKTLRLIREINFQIIQS